MALELLEAGPGHRILDLGCGTGSLCRPILRTGAAYTGIDLSPRMIRWARKHQPAEARFHIGDVTRLERSPVSGHLGGFTGAAFLLSLQDIDPLNDALQAARHALAPGGRLVIVMTHPCFRIPRLTGWSWDPRRRLASRRIDRYLTPVPIPLRPGDGSGRPGRDGKTLSYHRPLSTYMEALSSAGFTVERMAELPAPPDPSPPSRSPEERSGKGSRKRSPKGGWVPDDPENPEIPMFLALRATLAGR